MSNESPAMIAWREAGQDVLVSQVNLFAFFEQDFPGLTENLRQTSVLSQGAFKFRVVSAPTLLILTNIPEDANEPLLSGPSLEKGGSIRIERVMLSSGVEKILQLNYPGRSSSYNAKELIYEIAKSVQQRTVLISATHPLFFSRPQT